MSVEFLTESKDIGVMKAREDQPSFLVRVGTLKVFPNGDGFYVFVPSTMPTATMTCRDMRQICDEMSRLNIEQDRI